MRISGLQISNFRNFAENITMRVEIFKRYQGEL
jgi:hypothetical protein